MPRAGNPVAAKVLLNHSVLRQYVESKYKPLMRVQHETWGEGIVLESRVQGSEETVTINFESVGLKRLDAAIAVLEIIQ